MHGHVRRVGDQVAVGVEDRAGEVEPLLDVHRVGGVGERDPHLLGDRHEQVVEDLEQHGIRRRPERVRALGRDHALQHEVVARRERCAPAGLDHGGRIRFADHGGAVDQVAGAQVLAGVDVRFAERAAREHALDAQRYERARARRERRPLVARRLGAPDRLDRGGLDHQRPPRHQETVLAGVARLELGDDRRDRAPGRHLESRVRPFVLEVQRACRADPLRRDALCRDLAAGSRLEPGMHGLDVRERARVEARLDGLLAQCAHVGEAHAVRREDAGERMDEYARHAERVGHRAGMLAAGAAEAAQRVLGDVVAALDGDVLDRIGHVLDRDLQEPIGDFLGGARKTRCLRDFRSERRKLRPHHVGVERLVAVRAEHLREEPGIELADHHVAVGDGERPAAPVRRRPRVRARGLRADAKARAVERADRAAARRDRVDLHHRRAQPHARDLGDEGPLVLAGPVGDVGRRAAHVEADDAVEPGEPRDLDRADDATRGPRQDRVLALEAVRVGQPAGTLHELQPGTCTVAGELALDLRDVAGEDRRQVGVDHGRVAARDELHQRRHHVRHRNLREADAARERGQRSFVLREAVAVHQHDRDGADAGVERSLQVALGGGGVERPVHLAARAYALVHLDHALVEEARQLDVAHEELRPVLVADAQRIAEAAGDRERGALALALEERVGGDGRAHLHGVDRVGGDRRAGREAKEFADALHRGIPVTLRVLRQQLVRQQPAIRMARDDVGERATTVDPELPPFRHQESGIGNQASGSGGFRRRGTWRIIEADPVEPGGSARIAF